MTLVSIIIPCYVKTAKQAELLEETLSTVDGQTITDYEVIVVDDGSPPEMSDEIARIGSRHPRTTLLQQSNGGSALARNTGIAAARGDHLVFLDADDHLLPPGLETGLDALASHPECGFTVGAREEMTFDGAPVDWTVSPPPPQTDLYLPLLGFEWYISPPSSAMFRRSVVYDVGGFADPWGADDLDFYLRVARRHRAWCTQGPAVTRYRRYSASSSRDGERMLHSVGAVYARQWSVVEGDPAGEAAFHRGLQLLTDIFLDCLVENIDDRIRTGDREGALRSARILAQRSPERLRFPVEQLL